MGCLYLLESPSGKKYIGITKALLSVRLTRHKKDSFKRGSSKTAIQRAILKYGIENFKVETLVIANNWDYLALLEQRAIKILNTKAPNGYNLTDGGDGCVNRIYTEQERKKRSCSQLKSFQDPIRKERHKNSQNTPEIIKIKSNIQKERFKDPENKKLLLNAITHFWNNPENRMEQSRKLKGKNKINDELTKWQRYRLKDIDSYRKRKREYAKSPDQQIHRKEYAKNYRAKNLEELRTTDREIQKQRRKKKKLPNTVNLDL